MAQTVMDVSLQGQSILFVFHGSELGGAERQGVLLAKCLKEELGADVRIWGLGADKPGRVAQLCEESGIPWQGVPFHWFDRGVERLTELVNLILWLRKEKTDILLPYTWLPNVVCGLVWKFTGAKLCIWNQRDEGCYLNTGFWHKTAVRLTPSFISNSVAGKQILLNLYGISRDAVEVVHNGIMLPEPIDERKTWRKRLGILDDCFVACMVANLHIYKDHATLLKAWRVVLDCSPVGAEPPVLLLAGRFAGTEAILFNLADNLGISESVRFLGMVDDVAGLLHSVDLYVHSSKSEGCPNAVLEAMSAGLPVVATDIPGISDAVGSEGLDFLAPSGDPESLSDHILKFIENELMRQHVGSLLKKRVENLFNPKIMLTSTATLLVNLFRLRKHS